MGLKKRFEKFMVFKSSEFDCTNDAKFNNYFEGKLRVIHEIVIKRH